MSDPIIGHRLFVDGVTRAVYVEASVPPAADPADERQYVIHEDTGERIFGQWLWPSDEPTVAESER